MFLRSMCLMHSRSSGRRTGMAEQGLTHTPPHSTQQAHIPEPQASWSPSVASAPRWRRPGRRRLQVRIYTCLGVIWLFFYLFVQAYDDLCLLRVHPARYENHVGMFTQFSRSASSHSREDDDDAYGSQAETISGLSGPKSGGSEVIHLRRGFYSSWLFILIFYVQLTFTAGVRDIWIGQFVREVRARATQQTWAAKQCLQANLQTSGSQSSSTWRCPIQGQVDDTKGAWAAIPIQHGATTAQSTRS